MGIGPVHARASAGLDGLGAPAVARRSAARRRFYGWRELLAFAASFGLGLAATPLEITRFISMRDAATARYAIGVAFVFQAIVGSSIMMIGLSMRALFPALPTPDLASSVMAAHVLTPVAGALLIAAAFSAIMSTVNALLLVAGASLAHDFYVPLWRPRAGEAEKLAVNRGDHRAGTGAGGVRVREVALVQFIVALPGQAHRQLLFAPVVVGLNWARGTPPAPSPRCWPGWSPASRGACRAPAVGLDPIFPGVVASLLAFVIVSLLTVPVASSAAAPRPA